ncbi:MAG: hypothetical protein FJ108_03425 [Deltaproteobacteria bacterium]|nr:hypothetical protein [Deltaproteobacteria bacterium]
MRSRWLRGFALAAAGLAIAIWLAPALLLRPVCTRLLASSGISIELDGVRPAWPWGAAVERARVVRGASALEFAALRARLFPSGLRAEAQVGAGSLLLSTRGIRLRGGVLRAQSFPLDRLVDLAPSFGLRGTADGVYRFGDREALELTLSRGALRLRAPVAFELAFAQLVVAAVRERDGGWRVELADISGPPLSARATGRIGPEGGLAFDVEVTRLEEPAREAFAMAGLPTGPTPFRARIGGTLEAPIFSPLAR